MPLSFIIPLFNCLAYTQATYAGLQTSLPANLDYEIIFVDDGSTDGTREWLASLSDHRVRTVLNERNFGYARANNRGAAIARGEWLALINNDLVLTPGWVEPILKVLPPQSRSGIVGNVQFEVRTGEVDHTGIFINAKGKPEHDRSPVYLFDPAAKEVAAVTGACLFLQRQLWNELGGFDESFVNGCEDVDLCLRAREAGYGSVVATRSRIGHHISVSPGRKKKDEENTRKLTLRWKAQLTRLGTKAWCQHYLESELNAARAFAHPREACSIFRCAAGLSQELPTVALAGMQASIDRELARWDDLLGSR